MKKNFLSLQLKADDFIPATEEEKFVRVTPENKTITGDTEIEIKDVHAAVKLEDDETH